MNTPSSTTDERSQFLQSTFRALCHLAGADHRRISDCPLGDKQFAARIGLQLAMSSVFLFTIFTSSLLIGFGEDLVSDGIVTVMAFVTAAVILLVDIQIVQCDFYQHGLELARDRGLEHHNFIWPKIRRLVTVILRIGLSVTIAFAFATFFELRLFSSDIIRQIDNDYRKANAELFLDIQASYNAKVTRLSIEIANDDVALSALDLQDAELRTRHFTTTDTDGEIDGLAQKLARLELAKEATDTDALRRGGDAVNELNGVKETVDQSGSRGDGRRYKVAVARAVLAREESIRLSKEIRGVQRQIADLRGRRAREFERANSELSTSRSKLAEEIGTLRARRDATVRQRDQAVSEREATILAIAQATPEYVPKSDGFLARVEALEVLKDRPAVARTTFWTTLVIMAVEVSAVLSKVFFSTPTTYSVRTAIDFESEVAVLLRPTKSGEHDSQIDSVRREIKIEEVRAEFLTKRASRLSKEVVLSRLYPDRPEFNRSTS
jgi:hypothetical protein